MGELMRAMEQILSLPKKDLNKQELEVRETLEREQMRQESDESSHVGQPAKIEVAHQAQLFKLPDGTSGSALDVVILGAVITRANYVSREVNSGTLCQSIGGKVGNPSQLGYEQLETDIPDIRDMQVLCSKCPFGANSFGSDGPGKKCKEMRKLLVFHQNSKKPLILSIPPSSIRAFDTYFDAIDGAGKIMAGMKTKIMLKDAGKSSNKYSVFAFEAGPSLPPDQFMAGIKLREMFQDSIRSVDAGDYYQASSSMEDKTEVENVEDLPF